MWLAKIYAIGAFWFIYMGAADLLWGIQEWGSEETTSYFSRGIVMGSFALVFLAISKIRARREWKVVERQLAEARNTYLRSNA